MVKKDGYKKGDWIVHAYHGVGQIIGLDRKAIDGVNKTYFRVKTKTMTYWLPVENSDVDHIRPIASENIFTRSLEIIRKEPHEMAQDYRVREKDISEAFSACSINSLAALIRDLYGWRIVHGKKSMRDGDILIKAKNLFITEYAIAVDIDLEDARKVLEKALTQSMSSIRAKMRSLEINSL
jgi:RNA polymerase-interacting CarD/CdnL/TRCF family regulator